MKVIWTPQAEQDRSEIFDFIAERNPRAAVTMDTLFGQQAARLAEHPLIAPPGKIPGTRDLIPHENYRLVYEVQDDAVWVLALVHVARPWPPVSRSN